MEARAGLCCAVLALLASGCSYALLETARTEPPGTVGGSWGVAQVHNRIDEQGGRGGLMNVGPQVMPRVGVTDHLDIGGGPFEGRGVRVDGKYNLMRRSDALALAPRGGLGARIDIGAFVPYLGMLASYRVASAIEPYAGITFANYWILDPPKPEDTTLDRSERYAERSGTGDGILQAVVGLQLPAGTGVALLVEYGHWFPMQNDPGNFYRFIPSDILAVGMRFGNNGRKDPPPRAEPEPPPRPEPPPKPRTPRVRRYRTGW
jgi:hypothetical protein